MRRLVFVIGLALAAFVFFGGATWLAEYRVRAGLREAGVGARSSACMARRMVKRLSYGQLYRLQAFEGEKHGLGDYVGAVRRVGDAEVIAVTASSAALCATGLAR